MGRWVTTPPNPTIPTEPPGPKPVEPKPNPVLGPLPFSGNFKSMQQAKCSSLIEDFGQPASDPQLKLSPCHFHLSIQGNSVTAEVVSVTGARYKISGFSTDAKDEALFLRLAGKEISFRKEVTGNLGVQGSGLVYLMKPGL